MLTLLRIWLVKILPFSRMGFRVGIVLSAIIMPLEIAPPRIISLLSILFTLLVVQYPFIKLAVKSDSPKLSHKNSVLIGLALGLPFVALLLSVVFTPSSSASTHILRITFFFVVRAWIIARYAEATDVVLFERSVLWVAGVVVGFGYFQYFGDLAGVSNHITGLIEQYSSHGSYFFPRVHSFAHEPLYLANFLLVPIALLVWRVLIEKQFTWWRPALLIAMLGLFVSTNSRGAIVGLLLALVVCLAIARPARQKTLSLLGFITAGLVLAISMVGLAGTINRHDTVTSFIHHAVETKDKSFTNRSDTWSLAINAVAPNPVVGLGPSNSRHYIAGQTDYNQPVTKLPVFNNSYLTLFAEQGIGGVIAFIPMALIFAAGLARQFKRSANTQSFPYLLATLAILVQANTFEVSELPRTWILVGILLASYRINATCKEVG